MHPRKNIIEDHMVYFVLCGPGTWLPERKLSDMDRATTVRDIATGQFEGVVQVLECNPVEGICNDVTADMMRDAAFFILSDLDYEDLNDWQRDFVDGNAPGALAEHRVECRAEAAYRNELLPGRAGWGL
jgi:hypothetical protein